MKLSEVVLDTAVLANDLGRVKQALVQCAAIINSKNIQGALHLAARNGYLEIVKVLCEHQANETLINSDGDTPFHTAYRFEQLEVGQYLLDRQLQERFSKITEEFKALLLAAQCAFMKARSKSELQVVLEHWMKIITKVEVHKKIKLDLVENDDSLLQIDENISKESGESNKKNTICNNNNNNNDNVNKKVELINIISYCLEQLSEVYLQMANLPLKEYGLTSEKFHLRVQELQFKRQEHYVKAAQYSAAAEAVWRQAISQEGKAESNFFYQQQQRIQIRFMREQVDIQDNLPNLPALQTPAYRLELKTLRENIRQELDNTQLDTKTLLKHLTQGFIKLTREMLQACIDILDKPPCKYAVLGLGSMSRGEMSPYSDLEFAILIEKESESNRNYFRRLTQLLELQVINLGETKLPILSCGTESPTISGFCFDGGGNTPLGKQEIFELIGTPEQLAKFQQPQYFESDIITNNALKTVCLIDGSELLLKAYETAVSAVLNQNINKGIFKKKKLLREEQALQLLCGDLSEFKPDLSKKKEQEGFLTIKRELYRFPCSVIHDLSLFYGVEAKGVWDRTEALYQGKWLSQEGRDQIIRIMNFILRLRLRVHLFYGMEQETIYHETLYQYNWEAERQKNPAEFIDKLYETALPELSKRPFWVSELGWQAIKRFIIDDKVLKELTDLYKVLLPLECIAQVFLDTQGKTALFFKESNFCEDTLLTKGLALRAIYQFEKAAECFEKALAINPNDISALNALGSIQEQLGKTEGRLERLEKALNLTAQKYGKSHPEVATILNNLGNAYHALGRIQEALDYREQAFAIWQKAYGEQHPKVAIAFNNLGESYYELNEIKLAVQCFGAALTIFRKCYGEQHHFVGLSYLNFGMIWCAELNDFQKGIQYYAQALAIFSAQYEECRPHIASCFSNLGETYRALGMREQAISYHKRALSIWFQIFGEYHPRVTRSLIDLGKVYASSGDHREAIQLFEQALAVQNKVYGGQHIEIAETLHSLGVTYYLKSNEVKQAIECHEKALVIRRKFYGEEHYKVALSLNKLAELYHISGKNQQAVDYFEKTIVILKKTNTEKGNLFSEIAMAYATGAEIYRDLGDIPRAITFYKQSLELLLKIYGVQHPRTQLVMQYLNDAQRTLTGEHPLKIYEEQSQVAFFSTASHLNDSDSFVFQQQNVDENNNNLK